MLALPNVASDSAGIARNADHIEALLTAAGLRARQLTVDGAPPVVFGERDSGAATTVMVYVHYDGQPVAPENWASDPWTPVLRTDLVENGGREVPMRAPFDPEWRLFARSAGDDKAPIIALIHALAALDSAGIPLGVNLKVFFEGEEEAGSPHLEQILSRYREALGADLWLFCDGPMHQTRRMQLAFGVRGAVGFQLTVYGPGRPLHSGHYGNWAPNPIVMLSHLLAGMRDPEGRVLIEGFYDQVREISPAELAALDRIPRVDLALKQDLGLGRTETPEQRLERRILEPALNFQGFRAGGVGADSRNIIVPEATASLGIRLVPDQRVDELKRVVEAHLKNQGYHLVREAPDDAERAAHPRVARIQWGQGYPALRTPMDHPLAVRLSAVLDELAGGELIRLPTMGGSLPLYLIAEHLGAPVVILPIANHDNNQHGENENLRLKNLWDAIEVYAAVLAAL